jgi:lauroyl/myristoyl acyltransferase
MYAGAHPTYKNAFLNLSMRLTRVLGLWIMRLVAWFIAAGFFFFRKRRVGESLKFYRALYPGRGRLFHLYCTWRQFQTFAASQVDAIGMRLGKPIQHDSDGMAHIQKAAENGGAIVLTSHLGNWEIGARFFQRQGIPMTLFMGQRAAQEIGRQQKDGLMADGVSVSVSRDGEASLDSLDVLDAVKNGGLIALAGDVSYTPQRAWLKAVFLGREIQLPAAPHRLALMSGAPIITVLAWREKRNRHAFKALPPRYVTAGPEGKTAALSASAQRFADDLEGLVRRRPFQWGLFDPFLGPAAGRSGPGDLTKAPDRG